MEISNAADFLVHRHLRSGAGDRTALIGSRSSITYPELSQEVSRIAAGLRRLGLHRDDRIVLVMADDIEMAVSILAAFHAGFVAVPVSTMFNSAELAKILRDSGARAVVATPEFLTNVVPAVHNAPEVTHLIVADGAETTAAGSISLVGELIPPDEPATSAPAHTGEPAHVGAAQVSLWGSLHSPAIEPVPTSADSWALWLYTSGTTGHPKAAMHRHANIRHVYETYAVGTLGIRDSDICLSVAKMFFAYGLGNSLFFPLAAGATAVLQPARATPATIAARIAVTKPTLFFGVPTFYSALLTAGLPADTFASVRMGVSAGESLPEPLQRKFFDRYGLEILDGIGSTEALHIFLSNHPGDIRPGTTGRAVPGYQLEIRDAQGLPVGPGVPGELYVRGESIALGYWRHTEASRDVFNGHWLRTGDTYVMDNEGYYHCMGRTNDLLKAGGIWVSPAEVEDRLLGHEAVSETAVVGVPDAEGLDKPVALVVRAPGHEDITPEALIDWCRTGLAHFKCPRAVLFAAELPKTATGKVQRFRVREQLMSGAEAKV